MGKAVSQLLRGYLSINPEGIRLSTEHRSFTTQQFCVLVNASERGDLGGLLHDWAPNWSEDQLDDHIETLGRAVKDLIEASLVETYLSGTPEWAGPLSPAEAAIVLDNPRAWWNGDDGLEQVLWLALTDAGRAKYNTLSRDELYSYQSR